jgi:hypothetical protein
MKALPKARRLLVWALALGAIGYFGGCDSGALLEPNSSEQMQTPCSPSTFTHNSTYGDPCDEINPDDCVPMTSHERSEMSAGLTNQVIDDMGCQSAASQAKSILQNNPESAESYSDYDSKKHTPLGMVVLLE